MRADAIGLFWEEMDRKTGNKFALLEETGWTQVRPGYWLAPEHNDKQSEDFDEIQQYCMTTDLAYQLQKNVKQGGVKRQPPEPVWLSPDYLPFYDIACKPFKNVMSDFELVELAQQKYMTGKNSRLVYDIECYANYFLIAFKSIDNNKIFWLDFKQDESLYVDKLEWVLSNFTLIGFNNKKYDDIITALAMRGFNTTILKTATTMIIEENIYPTQVLKQYKTSRPNFDSIDLIEVAPLFASLKIYGGNLHCKRMQDLPFPPNSILTDKQIQILRWYCINDLDTTQDLYLAIYQQIKLRESMSEEYGIDLRSKSDAQIAEAVITHEVEYVLGHRVYTPTIEPGTQYYYQAPQYLSYVTPQLQQLLNEIKNCEFIVGDSGAIGLPPQIKQLKLEMGESIYQMGIGGLHSTEKSRYYLADDIYSIEDWDVTSFYPTIILNLKLFPAQLTEAFLEVYNSLVERRVEAKHNKLKLVADTLKIVINGSFGKFGSKYSKIYAPLLLIMTTITGQLSLLQLIEALEYEGIRVISANTDGIVLRVPKRLQEIKQQIIDWWCENANFEMECTHYEAIYSKDVNNYIAVKQGEYADINDKIKGKGMFASVSLSKNVANTICIEAVKNYLVNGVDIAQTITQCRDIRKFVTVRTVNGGGVKLDSNDKYEEYLGKAVRWYYATGDTGVIVYAKNGNKVPKSEGSKPIMELPDELPGDINYNWYIQEAETYIKWLGVK